MTATSIRAAVGQALRDRVASVTTANGYPVGIRNVYFDRIPLGLELTDADLPAAFVLDDGADHRHEHGVLMVRRTFRVQIVAVDAATDEDLALLLRSVAKAVWANHPTADVQDAYRFHERVFQVEMVSDDTDLHLVEANRIAATTMVVHYRTRPNDL